MPSPDSTTSRCRRRRDREPTPDMNVRPTPYGPETRTTCKQPTDWFRILPAKKYGEEHPEYFALVGGKRQSHFVSPRGNQVCTINPNVIRIFVEVAIELFRENPKRDMFSMSVPQKFLFRSLDG